MTGSASFSGVVGVPIKVAFGSKNLLVKINILNYSFYNCCSTQLNGLEWGRKDSSRVWVVGHSEMYKTCNFEIKIMDISY